MPSAIMLGGARPVALGPRTGDGRRAGRVYLRRWSISPAATLTLKAGFALAASHGRPINIRRRR
jgi:hypothetical protein